MRVPGALGKLFAAWMPQRSLHGRIHGVFAQNLGTLIGVPTISNALFLKNHFTGQPMLFHDFPQGF